jgi:hypothetical protein
MNQQHHGKPNFHHLLHQQTRESTGRVYVHTTRDDHWRMWTPEPRVIAVAATRDFRGRPAQMSGWEMDRMLLRLLDVESELMARNEHYLAANSKQRSSKLMLSGRQDKMLDLIGQV